MDRRLNTTPVAPSGFARHSDASRRSLTAYASALLFVSGGAALIYQVIWVKQLSLVVGAEIYAISIAISGFFGGLALGSWLFGRWADRSRRPIRLYVLMEIATAVTGVATTWALARVAPLFVDLQLNTGILTWVLVLGLVGLPAIAMGGTMPVLVRALSNDRRDVGRSGGALYAANTGGAILGALLPVFLFIPAFGVQGTVHAAAALNVAAAIGAIVLDWLVSGSIEGPSPTTPRVARDRLALALYGAAGGVALGYEIVWSQAIVQFMSTRSVAFAVVLATYLGGIALGALLFARWSNRVGDAGGVFGLLIATAGWIAMMEIAVLGHWLIVGQTLFETVVYRVTASDLAGMCARFAVAAIFIVFVPTVLLGAAFPAALKLIAGDARIGRDVGLVVAVNTLGGIAGTLVTGFLLIPWLGLVRTLGVLAILAALIGVVATIVFAASSRIRWAISAVCAASILVAVATPADQLIRLLPAAQAGRVAFYEESGAGTVAVVETANGSRRFRRLYIQGVSNSGDAMPSLRYMRLQALLPLIIHNGNPKSALVIGYGTGITAGALSQFPMLERRVVSELLPAVLRAAPNFRGTFDAATDPGLEKRLRDGRMELQHSNQHYDLITLEPPPPSAAGVVNLYSRDFYKLAGSRLNDKGIVAQWLPLPTQNDEDTRALVRSFIDIFPYASLWSTELHETMLVGSFQPIELDVQRISERFDQASTSAALAAVGIGSPAALISTWITDREGLKQYVGGTMAVTDDRPAIEYAGWVRPGEFARTFSNLQQLRNDPPLQNANEKLMSTLAAARKELDAFYKLALSVYARDRQQYAENSARVSEVAKTNPYYRWFVSPKQQP
ncbi:fused MFS/spermidine synthase [Bradyrhizobium sp. 139]|uniref:fused MFS/spermidine synthase n=1 Tax=Bradyrhizobium sp. 139 TaxID=2782616 RepID=UPI001FF744EA|nr:fused MFS/spermidine synthase [Bradyrhizobium sp. 139]MCK1740486.1 fused MFS/spermidine synthase [Bradyrhizobium sp. 139]